MPAFESGQQQQAVSPSIKDTGAFTPPVHGKTAAAEAIITKALAGNILMKELAADDRVMLMQAMTTVSFTPGQQIIRQGDRGDKFYVIGAGTCDISVKGKGTVMKASRGVAFGELALMFNQPRAASVTAEGDVVAWQVDAITFKWFMESQSSADGAAFEFPISLPPLSAWIQSLSTVGYRR